MSASRIPTLKSKFNSARAKLIAVVDFPTPPLPLATAIMCWAGLSRDPFGLGFSLSFFILCAVSNMLTFLIHWIEESLFSIMFFRYS